MWADLPSIQQHFAAYVASNGSRGPSGAVAEWLARGELDPAGFLSIVDREGCARDEWFRKQMLDLALGFLASAGRDGPISETTINTAAVLKRALHVPEGDFLRWRPVEVSTLVVAQLDLLLADGLLTEEEDLYCVELQALFDLSLDQYLRLARPAFERAWSGLIGRIEAGSLTATARERAERAARNLEPLYNLAQMQPRSLGALY